MSGHKEIQSGSLVLFNPHRDATPGPSYHQPVPLHTMPSGRNAEMPCQLTKTQAGGDNIDQGGVKETSRAATVHRLQSGDQNGIRLSCTL